MKIGFSILLVVIVSAGSLWAQLRIEADKLPLVVAYIETQSAQTLEKGGKKYEIWLKGESDASPVLQVSTDFGTAFFVAFEGAKYLVTAAHVADKTSTSSEIRILGPNRTPVRFGLKDLGLGGDRWIRSPGIDLAALRLQSVPEPIALALGERFLPEAALTSARGVPDLDRDLTIIGFPFGLGVSGSQFSPVVVRSTPASGVLAAREISSPFFALERSGIGGFSGSPVIDLGYTAVGGGGASMKASYGPTVLVGVLVASLSDKSGGLAIVLPTALLVQLLRGAA